MNTNELIEKIKSITNVNKQVGVIYEVLDELGVKYAKTSCSKCRRDLLNIAREELGLIDDAAEQSAYNAEQSVKWKYNKVTPTVWRGMVYDWYSADADIENLMRAFPNENFYILRDNNNIDLE